MRTQLQMLRGNPGRRPLNDREPQPQTVDASFDTPPDELQDDPLAKKEWTRIVPMLRACGLLTNAERPVMIALCQQWAIYLEAHQRVRQLGMVVKSPSAHPVVNPYVKIGRAALAQCQRLWIELGLTPSSRSRLTTVVPSDAPVTSKWQNDL